MGLRNRLCVCVSATRELAHGRGSARLPVPGRAPPQLSEGLCPEPG